MSIPFLLLGDKEEKKEEGVKICCFLDWTAAGVWHLPPPSFFMLFTSMPRTAVAPMAKCVRGKRESGLAHE
jgi:hypothetical protein